MLISQEYFQYWSKTDRDVKMTPQVIYLEKYLNDRYGVTTIKIVDGYQLGPFMYNDPPAGKTDLFMIEPHNYMYSESIATTVDFVVQIPEELRDENKNIAATVAKFKLGGKIFIIQIL